jgi:hypothetical protein
VYTNPIRTKVKRYCKINCSLSKWRLKRTFPVQNRSEQVVSLSGSLQLAAYFCNTSFNIILPLRLTLQKYLSLEDPSTDNFAFQFVLHFRNVPLSESNRPNNNYEKIWNRIIFSSPLLLQFLGPYSPQKFLIEISRTLLLSKSEKPKFFSHTNYVKLRFYIC